MKFLKALKRLNPVPLLRGSCVRSQNDVADGEEVVAIKCCETPVDVSESAKSLCPKSDVKSKTDVNASKIKMSKLLGVKSVAKRFFLSNRRANHGNTPVALATHSTRHWRFWSPKNAVNTLTNDINPVPSTPQPPADSPAAAAAALNLPYPLPVATAPVDLSPLASGLQLTGGVAQPEDFVIRAFPGNQKHLACTPHPATGSMLIRPFSAPASTSPRYEVISVRGPGSGISRREITMNDVRDELDKIFAQLPAAKASPTKAAGSSAIEKDSINDCNITSPATNASADLNKSTVKKVLMMTPTCDAAVQTELSNADDVIVDSKVAFTAEAALPDPAVITNMLDDGKANYAWGNSGRTMRLSAAAAAKLGMRVFVPEEATVAEPATEQKAAVNSGNALTTPVSVPDDDKVTVAWGNKGHTMRLSRAAAAKLGMKVIVPETEMVGFTAAPALDALATPTTAKSKTLLSAGYVSAAILDGPIKDAPTPACSPADSLMFSMSPCITPCANAAHTSTAKTVGNKRPPPIRTSTFDVAAIMLKLANNGVTPPPSTTTAGKSFSEMSLKELVSTPLSELYPGLYGPDDELLSPFKDLVPL